MTKLVELDRTYYPSGGIGYWCPGCNQQHEITVDVQNHSGGRWKFDGNIDAPTFDPSINYRVNTPDMKGYQPDIQSHICHHFVRSGRIEFLSDSTHPLRGQTVDLPDFPDGAAITSRRMV